MPEQSAGILMYRRTGSTPELLLVHLGGPFWAKKDDGAWSIPKGLFAAVEEPLSAAIREFEEETGLVPTGMFLELGQFRQPSGKLIFAWALEGAFDVGTLRSNSFSIEWPPRSGRIQDFPEVDRAGWFAPADAMRKILGGQRPIISALLKKLGVAAPDLPRSDSTRG